MRIDTLWHLANVRWLTQRRLFHGWVGLWTEARQNSREVSLLHSIRALGLARERRAVPALVKALQDFRLTYMCDSVGAAAARALGEIGDPSAIAALKKQAFVESTSALVIDAAIEALGKIGDEEVAHALLCDCLLATDDATVLLDKVFRTDTAGARGRAAVKALALMKGICPPHPGDYESIPLQQLVAGELLPLPQRRSPDAGSATDPSAVEQELSDFANYHEKHFIGDIERATRAIMGRYGLTSAQAGRVRDHYLATVASKGGARQ